MFSILVKVCVIAAMVCVAQAQIPATPIIQSVSRAGGDGAVVQWKVDDPAGNLRLSRYRIQVSTDDFKTANDWPAQTKKVNYDSTDTTYKQLVTKSNYECFNECIKDVGCGFVVRSSKQAGDNCFLKATLKSPTNTSLDADSEYMDVADYANNATLKYLTPGLVYSIKVAVYDSKSQVWSQFSNRFGFNFQAALNLKFDRNGVTAGNLVWNNNGMTFSRFNLYSADNGTELAEVPNINPNALETYEHASGYFSIRDYANYTSTTNRTECIVLCLNDYNCVQVVYFTADYLLANGTVLAPKFSCFINYQLDVLNAVYKKADVTILSVRNTYEYFEYYYIEWAVWQFQLEVITPYGVVQRQAGSLTYNLTDSAPTLKQATLSDLMTISWKLPEPLNLTRFALFYYLNESSNFSYYIEESNDYYDPEQIVMDANDTNECFELCYEKHECLAYTFVPDEKRCELKTNLNNETECLNSTVCAIMPSYTDQVTIDPLLNTFYCLYAYVTTSFNYTTPAGKLICTTLQKMVRTEKVDQFLPGMDARIRCLPVQYNKQINWYRNLQLLNETDLNATISEDRTYMTFHKVSGALVNGVYHCENVLNNTQLIASSNYLSIQVNETVPKSPVSPRVEPAGSNEKPSIIISWNYDPYTLPVTRINLYTSTSGSRFQNKTYVSDTLSTGVIIIEEKFECKTVFKFQAINVVGASEMSNEFRFDQKRCEDSPQEPGTNYFTAFIVTVCLAGLFVLIGLGLLIRRCTKPRPRRSSISLR